MGAKGSKIKKPTTKLFESSEANSTQKQKIVDIVLQQENIQKERHEIPITHDYLIQQPEGEGGALSAVSNQADKNKSSFHSTSHLPDKLGSPQKDSNKDNPDSVTPSNVRSGNRSILSKGGAPDKNKINLFKKDRNIKPRFTIGGKDIVNEANKKKYTTLAERQYSIQMGNIARTLGELERANSIGKKERNINKSGRKTRIDEYLFNLQMGGMDEQEKLMQIEYGMAEKSMNNTMPQSRGLSSQYTLKMNSEKNQITLHTMMKIMTANETNWLKSTRHLKTCISD